MAESKFDNNNIPTMTGVLNTDGATPTLVKADLTTHELLTSDNTTGSDFGADNAARDNNGIPVLMAVSDVDGSSIVPLYVDSDGNLLIDST